MDLASLADLPVRAAERWPRRTALVFRGRRLSYRRLLAGVDAVRGALADLGVKPGDRVAVHLENRPEYLQTYYAVPGLGAVLVPLNTFLAPAELSRLLADSGASALVTSEGSLAGLAPALAGQRALRSALICPGAGDDPAAGLPAALAVARLAERSAPPSGLRPVPRAGAPDDTAVLLYTSGTTGEPRGVMLSHRNILANAAASIEAVGITARDRVLVCLPMFHSFTETVCMVAPVMAGMTIVLCSGVDRAEVRRALARHRPSIFPAVPAVFAAMARVRVGPLSRWLNPVRLYISGGAPLSVETLEQFERTWRRPLCEGYGLSEASPVVSLNPPEGPRKPGSVGRPLPGVRIRVAGPDGDRPAGEVGELLVSAPSVMKGYHGRGEETASVLSDGWLRTGDLGFVDEEGYIFIAGRSKEMLICRGMNVYPREIEEALERHPAVKEAAVVGVPDTRRGEVPLAFVVTHPGTEVTEVELRRACAAHLARYKVPRSVHLLDALPRNPTGKVLKETLKERALSLPGAPTRAARPGRALRPGM